MDNWWEGISSISDLIDKYYEMQDYVEKKYESEHDNLIKDVFESMTYEELDKFNYDVVTLGDFKFNVDIYDIEGYSELKIRESEELSKLDVELEEALSTIKTTGG